MEIEEGEVGLDEDAVAGGLGGAGGAVVEGGEIEREASDHAGGRDVGGEDAVEEHEGLEGDDPVVGFVQAVGESPYEGLEEGWGGANPVEDSLGVLIVDE